MKTSRTGLITQSAAIAAVYVVLTLVFAPISYGEVQVRISEALTILPVFTPAAVQGLFIGCLIANLSGGAVIWDIIFGSIATLLGAFGTRLLRKHRWLAPIPPILSNTVIVPLVLRFCYGVNLPIPLLMLFIAAGEIISCFVLGEILYTITEKYGRSLMNTSDSR